ncbi:DNA-processing protein DprA [Rubrobacter calidifluminis]|uniref:DNA-processing protein DprA n=1 Tax=Rubrobacter calidifluminis TaxID=1392640 RepID=UPI00235F10C6|nr:DNA-processing protein DprA [Rubrobacter calidifluminis]
MPGVEGRDACLLLSLVQARVGASILRALGEREPEVVLEERPERLREMFGLSEKAVRVLEEIRHTFDAESVVAALAERGASVVTLADEGYPERLRQVPDPPPALFLSGGAIPDGPAVALVGSRKASAGALEAARELGRALAGRGVNVISGLALGVDAAAHEGALEAGNTVGVLGCGIDVVYPRQNRDLYERVRRQGTILSEYYLGEAPLAWRFPARNRIIAGLADVVVVVEASQRSGALITARHALDAGREVWAVPGPIGVPECRGSNRLISEGASPLWDVGEFVEAVAPPSEEEFMGRESLAENLWDVLPHREAAVLAGIGFTPCSVDQISRRSGVDVREVLRVLPVLELKGYVRRDVGGMLSRTGPVG